MGRVEQTRSGRRSSSEPSACAPDLDLLVHDHRGPAHSLGAAILVALAMSLLTRNLRWGLATGLAWTSHVMLDWLGNDSSPPIGLMALWPLSHQYFQSSLHLFPAVSRSYGHAEFWVRQREGADRGGLRAGTAGGGCDHDRPAPSSRSMTLPRFLASDLDPVAGSASLSAEEAHHLMHVLRLRFGDEISVFDGGGREYAHASSAFRAKAPICVCSRRSAPHRSLPSV